MVAFFFSYIYYLNKDIRFFFWKVKEENDTWRMNL
jgi:hypothetical protein